MEGQSSPAGERTGTVEEWSDAAGERRGGGDSRAGQGQRQEPENVKTVTRANTPGQGHGGGVNKLLRTDLGRATALYMNRNPASAHTRATHPRANTDASKHTEPGVSDSLTPALSAPSRPNPSVAPCSRAPASPRRSSNTSRAFSPFAWNWPQPTKQSRIPPSFATFFSYFHRSNTIPPQVTGRPDGASITRCHSRCRLRLQSRPRSWRGGC